MKILSVPRLQNCFASVCLTLACSSLSATAQGLSPQEALAKMEVATGFEVKLFASEPEVRQPVAMYFDERGRMWVIQSSPNSPQENSITICEDADGDGPADKFKDFVTGLNVATGLAIGYGGVYVLQAPDLLFYPDRDRDDIPDGDPEILLTGFSAENAHAVANSLQWGPDGWLYGTHGSAVASKIRDIEFQQGIWRFHPKKKKFELFSEGGENAWGLDFDQDGQAIAGVNSRDGVALHHVQGGYHRKNVEKYGGWRNPYTYGFLGPIPYKDYEAGGIASGGIIYRGGLFPSEFKNSYIAANLMGSTVNWHKFTRDGSTYKAEPGGSLIDARDPSFRPVDCALGPDGAVYVADCYGRPANLLDHDGNSDRSKGRIYRLAPKGTRASYSFDLHELSTVELVAELPNKNNWFVRESRRLLAERADRSIGSILHRLTWQRENHQLAVEAFWTLTLTSPQWRDSAHDFLHHYSPTIRAWAIRLLADEALLTPRIAGEFLKTSQSEVTPQVRSQLAACLGKIADKKLAVRIIFNLLEHDMDANDQHIPLLLWWALEPLLTQEPDAVIDQFESGGRWKTAMMRSTILERIGRRLSAGNEALPLTVLARLYDLAPSLQEIDILTVGVEKGFRGFGNDREKRANPLAKTVALLWSEKQTSQPLLRLNIRAGNNEAINMALKQLKEGRGSEADRIAIIEAFSGRDELAQNIAILRSIMEGNSSDSLKKAALSALHEVNEPAKGEADGSIKEN
ncbi:MAG: PVC-type heme-binding CxxCH protein [Verrucomicrobiales bacterium]